MSGPLGRVSRLRRNPKNRAAAPPEGGRRTLPRVRRWSAQAIDHPAPARGYPGCPQHKAVYSPADGFAALGVPEIPTGSPRGRPTGLTRPCGACLDERDRQTNTPAFCKTLLERLKDQIRLTLTDAGG